MTRTIRMMAISLLRDPDAESMSEYFITNLDRGVLDHAPKGIRLLDVSWSSDPVVSAFFTHFLTQVDSASVLELRQYFSVGVYSLRFETPYEIGYRYLPWLDWIIQRQHDGLEYVSSYFLYVIEEERRLLHMVASLRTPSEVLEEDEEIDVSRFDHFAYLLDDHLNNRSISDPDAALLAGLLLRHGGDQP